ncbi:MAG: endonuclease MutS2 [Candidatus Kapaibacterium sp.]
MSKELDLLRSRLLIESEKELEFGTVLEEISKLCNSTKASEYTLNIKPYNNVEDLRDEFDLTEDVIQIFQSGEELPLSGLREIDSSLKKAQIRNAVLDEYELLRIKDNLRVFRLVNNYIYNKSEYLVNLSKVKELIHFNQFIEKHIDDAISDNGEVKDTASKELQSIRRNILSTSDRLRNKLQSILKKTFQEDLLQDDFYTMREERFVIPVKTEFKKQIPGIIHGLSNTGSTVFLEPSEIIDMNNSLSILRNDEKKEIYRILSEITEEIGQEAEVLRATNELITRIDLINAKAKYARKYDGMKPVIVESNEIELKDIYHPLLLKNKNKKQVTPLTISFDTIKQGHLISGPNAGGKTVALKNIGLNLLMAMSGIYTFGYCKTGLRDVFTSIGDHQSIEMDLSTFSSQMKRIKDILDVADPDALMLVDEICSGTDPKEGSALASGILDTTLKYNLKFIVTTHQSSLKTYALNKENIENASLEFDETNLKPTYNFLAGVPGNSYAFNLAESIGLSKLILERAESYLDTKDSEIDRSISEIVNYRKQAEKMKLDAETSLRKAENKQLEYERLVDEIRKNKSDYKLKAQQEANLVLAEANKLVENTIREIQEGKRKLGEVKKEFEMKKEELKRKVSQPFKKEVVKAKTDDKIEKGDIVRIDIYDTPGLVIEIVEDDKHAVVEFNGLKFRTELSKLVKVTGKIKKDNSKSNSDASKYFKMGAETRIDVRGERVNEAIAIVENFMNDAVIAGLPFLTILHGKGTGALRQAIHEYLKMQSSIKTFRNGTLAEGGEGVTVLELE